jgi:hypothetical protein
VATIRSNSLVLPVFLWASSLNNLANVLEVCGDGQGSTSKDELSTRFYAMDNCQSLNFCWGTPGLRRVDGATPNGDQLPAFGAALQ